MRPPRIGPGTQIVNLLLDRPDSIQPGLYAAASDSPAYPLLRAMIAAKDADLLGEHYAFSPQTPQGWVKLTTAGVKRAIGSGAMPRRVAANPQIGMGAESFVSELKNYDNWRIKWWREVVQNSVDAGATRIDLSAVDEADGTWTVSCTDNGGGMPEVILVTKFLYLGATTKVAQAGAAGGFGVAKKLILLPWILWEVITGDVHVVGHGVTYYKVDDLSPEAEAFFEEVGGRPKKESRHGTTVRVNMPGDKHTDNIAAVAFLEKCYLPGIKFTVNGETVKANLKAKELVEEAPGKADVYFTKKRGITSYHLLVRSRGLFMFEEWIEKVEGVLIAEITAPSIEILTSNRDGFRDSEVKFMIRNLANRIAVDRKSALRKKKGIIRKKYQGVGKFEAIKAQVQDQMHAEALASAGSLTPSKKGKLDGFSFEGIIDVLSRQRITLERVAQDTLRDTPPHELSQGTDTSLSSMLSVGPDSGAEIIASTSFEGVDHVEAAIKQLVWQPDFYVFNDVEGYKVPKKFFPETMTPTIFKLAKVWTEICRYVMIQLGCSLPFGVGWIFQEGTGAAYQGSTDKETYFKREGEHWLLLNPHKNSHSRKEVWHPTKAKDLKWLYAAAVHESTHMADGLSYHDESFAAALTRNMAKTADGFKHVRKIANSVKMAGSLELRAAPSVEGGRKPANPLAKFSKKELVDALDVAYLGKEALKRYSRMPKGELLQLAFEQEALYDLWDKHHNSPWPGDNPIRDWIGQIS